MLLSIAICTYNRQASLRRALNSLHEMAHTIDSLDWEVLVVDNNSTDETRDVVQAFEGKLPVRYVFEPQQGLSAARNTALRLFQGDWIIFTDDDMTFSKTWLRAYSDQIKTLPTLDFLSGPIMPKFEMGKPHWLTFPPFGNLAGMLGYYNLGNEDMDYQQHTHTPFGANFALSRKVVESHGQFNTLLGRKGEDRGRGEETHYFQSLLSYGAQGRYLAKALNYHWVERGVFTVKYCFRHGYAKGIEGQYLSDQNEKGLHLDCSQKDNDVGDKPENGWLFFIKQLSYQTFGFIKQYFSGNKDKAYQCVIMIGLVSAQVAHYKRRK